MKKLLIAILIFSGCANNIELPQFETREEAGRWVYENIEYKLNQDLSTWGESDYWQTVEQTLAIRQGDCEDLAILLMYILKSQFIENPELIIVNVINSRYNHVIIKSNNVLYDPSNNRIIMNTIYCIIMIIIPQCY